MWKEEISILQYISIATFNGKSISNLLLPLFIGLFKWCTFWRWDQKFFIPFTGLLIILIYSGTFGVQHVYFCIDNVIFNRFITDIHVFSLWETQNYRIHKYMIEKNNEIIMDYSHLVMINSEICNGILNCNTRSYVIPVYWYTRMNHTYMCIFSRCLMHCLLKGGWGLKIWKKLKYVGNFETCAL